MTRDETMSDPLTAEEAAVFDEWFGPPSDDMSIAVRRAIRDGLLATLDAARQPTVDVEALREAAFKSEMARRAAVGSLRNVRRSLGALIQVLLHDGYTLADNEHLRTAIGANIVSLTNAEQRDEDYRAAALAAQETPERLGSDE